MQNKGIYNKKGWARYSPQSSHRFSTRILVFYTFIAQKHFPILKQVYIISPYHMPSPNPKISPEKCEEFYHAFCSSPPTIRGLQEKETENREIRIHAGTLPPPLYMLNLSLTWRRLSSPNPKIFLEKGLEFYHTFCSSHPTIRGLQEEETGNREIRMNAGTFLPCSI